MLDLWTLLDCDSPQNLFPCEEGAVLQTHTHRRSQRRICFHSISQSDRMQREAGAQPISNRRDVLPYLHVFYSIPSILLYSTPSSPWYIRCFTETGKIRVTWNASSCSSVNVVCLFPILLGWVSHHTAASHCSHIPLNPFRTTCYGPVQVHTRLRRSQSRSRLGSSAPTAAVRCGGKRDLTL